MSRAIPGLSIAEIVDPITNIDSSRVYGVLRGGQIVQERSYDTTDFSNSQMSFTINPNSLNTVIDRNIKVKVPVTIDFVGTTTGGGNLLETGYDAFRANPISSITQNLEVKINGTTTSIRLADTKDILLNYNTGYDVRNRDYSTSPSMQDQYQRYDAQAGNLRNPLSGYGDSYEIARGAFNYTSFANTTTTGQIKAVLVEPMFLSPFVFGHQSRAGFYNISQMVFSFNFISDLTRIWSHAVGGGATFSSITVTIEKPSMLVKQISPRTDQVIPRSLIYPYYEVVSHVTRSSNNYAPNDVNTEISQSIQLNSVPRRMYICMRRNKADRYGSSGYLYTDSYFAVDQLIVEYGTKNLLSAAKPQDLYKMSIKNGYSSSWERFSGGLTYDLGATNTPYGTSSAPVCIEFGTDIALGSLSAPGLLDKQQLQITGQFRNVNQTDTINQPEMVVLIVYEGIFTIQPEMTSKQIGILSQKDVLNAGDRPKLDYFESQDAYGGNFFSGLKKLFKGFTQSGKKVFDHLPEIVEKATPIVKTIMKEAPALLPLIGLGLSDVELERAYTKHMRGKGGVLVGGRKKKRGGVLVGGKRMTAKELLKRL